MVSQAQISSVEAPTPRVTLTLPEHGRVDFLPTNRPAEVRVGALAGAPYFHLKWVTGAYSVSRRDDRVFIQGEANTGGFASLRFAYRVDGLPEELADTDLALLNEAVQRHRCGETRDD